MKTCYTYTERLIYSKSTSAQKGILQLHEKEMSITATNTALIFGVGLVLGCHFGTYFLSCIAVIAMVLLLAHVALDREGK
jgi:hypothetical protein